MNKKGLVKKKYLALAIAAPWLVASGSLQALTDQEVDQRLQQYEQRIKTLEQQLQETGVSQAAPGDVQRVEKTTQRLSQKIDSISKQLADTKQRFNINGFFTAGAAYTNSPAEIVGLGLKNDPDYEADSIIGLQFQFQVNDRTDLVTQLTARGREDYSVETEWAYIRYRFTDDIVGRAGRLRMPFFMLSEFRDVGYALPWVRAPQSVYGGSPFDNYEGFDLTYNYTFGNFDGNTSILTGRSSQTNAPIDDLTINDVVGFNSSLSYGDLTFRVGFARGRITSDTLGQLGGIFPGSLMDKTARGDFGGIGARYDNGSLLVMAEAVQNRRKGALSNTRGNYLTVGYRFGDWMPNLTYMRRYTTDDSQRDKARAAIAAAVAAAPPAQQAMLAAVQTDVVGLLDANPRVSDIHAKSWIAGVRYDVMTGMAIKAEFQHVFDFEDSTGMFVGDPGGPSVNVYSLVIDTVF